MNARVESITRIGAVVALTGCLFGCRSHDDWLPLKVGTHWTYQVRSGFDVRIEPIKVLRPLAVASASGYELTGPLGVSRLAWKNGTLYADSAASVQFIPALPMLRPGVDLSKDKDKVEDTKVSTWHGRVVLIGKERPGSAVLTERTESIELGTRKVPTILATVALQIPGRSIVLKSWYQQGVGLVQQEQRTNGARVIQLQMLGHGD